jgi:hypothetical protein
VPTGGVGTPLGTTSRAQSTDLGSFDRLDVLLIGSLSCLGSAPGSVCAGQGFSQPQIYVGDVGVNEDIRIVKNRTTAVPGMVVCSSGSFSGTRCDLQVEEVDVRQEFLFGGIVRELARARHRFGESASGQGDSGGPVYTPRGTTNEVNAAGIVVGGTADATCRNVINRVCGTELYFQPIFEALRVTDVWLEVQ